MYAEMLDAYVNMILSDPFRSWGHDPHECGAPYFTIDGADCYVVREGYSYIGRSTITANRLEDGRTVCFVNREMFVLPKDARKMAREIDYVEGVYKREFEREFDRECREQYRAERLDYLNDGAWDAYRANDYTTYYG